MLSLRLRLSLARPLPSAPLPLPAVKAAGISVMGGGSYEKEFAAEMARAKTGKAKATPWGSGYGKAPEILHGAALLNGAARGAVRGGAAPVGSAPRVGAVPAAAVCCLARHARCAGAARHLHCRK